MISKTVTLLFFLCIGFAGCSPDVTTVQVIRNPLIKFDYNGNDTWQTTQYSFGAVSSVVVYPQDTTQPAQVYNRFTFESLGKDSAGNMLQLIITFDAVNINDLTGIYSSSYTSKRGLAEVQLYNLTDNANLAAYSLCSHTTSNAEFAIDKQKPDEKLITGTFHVTLCDLRDTTKKLSVTNGAFTDITY
jgi:hypothetical protein